MFCPMCQSLLHEHTLLDPHLTGYICANGHVYYTNVVEQVGVLPEANTIRPPAMDDDVQVLKYWLTDPHARKTVPDQLAVACRRIVEIVEKNLRVPRVNEPFAFCPVCGEKLLHVDSDDTYLQCLRCRNAHQFWWRGTRLHYDGDVRRNLSAELDDEFLLSLIEYYSSSDEIIKPYDPPQLQTVLKHFGT